MPLFCHIPLKVKRTPSLWVRMYENGLTSSQEQIGGRKVLSENTILLANLRLGSRRLTEAHESRGAGLSRWVTISCEPPGRYVPDLEYA
jgi:hypothetical protein